MLTSLPPYPCCRIFGMPVRLPRLTVTKLMEMHGDNTTEDVGMEMEREDEGEGEEAVVADE